MNKFTIEKSTHQDIYTLVTRDEIGYITNRDFLTREEIENLHSAIHAFLGDQKAPKKMKPLRPGEVLFEEFIKPKYGSVKNFTDNHFEGFFTKEYYFDITTGGDRRITDFHAGMLANIFGTTPEFWLNLQADYDREMKGG
jgi:plasmid maintenance system antidote protein VapI